MTMLRAISSVTLAIACLALTATAAPQKPSAANGKSAQQTAVAPAQTPTPTSPEQMPAVQPRVTLQNGLLAIHAPNSTMSDVLNAVRRQTGATFELPPGMGGDRIVAHIGPGKPKDVLASLLSGSRFNFIIVGPPQNPDGIQKVILTRRQAAAPQSAAAGGQPSFNPQEIPPPEEEYVEEVEPEMPPEEMVQPEPVPTPTLQPGQDPAQQQQQQANPNQPKTPEQLLQELQRMQQQQQQQQQQADPNQQQANPNQQQADPNQQQFPQLPPDRNPGDE